MMDQDEYVERWRLILGKDAEEPTMPLEGEARQMDQALEKLYQSGRKGGLGDSMPHINRWLGDIRKYFPKSVVHLLQKDAFERFDVKKMLLDEEFLTQVEPDIHLATTLLSLKSVMPEKTKQSARLIIQKLVEELQAKLRLPTQQAIRGSLNRASRKLRPKLSEIDWPKTIRANLHHYQADLQTIIPEKLIGYASRNARLKDVILCVDQSGSMMPSVVYASVFASVLASIPALQTHIVAFDTSVVDLSEHIHDPVELLFGIQLGGGTDINRALQYCQQLIRRPSDTILVLISDLYEGGNRAEMVQRAAQIKQRGVNLISLLSLSDEGTPIYDRQIAGQLKALEIPCFGCTPDVFPELMAKAI